MKPTNKDAITAIRNYFNENDHITIVFSDEKYKEIKGIKVNKTTILSYSEFAKTNTLEKEITGENILVIRK